MKIYRKTSKALLSALLIGLIGVTFNMTKAGRYLDEEWGLAALFNLRGPLPPPRDVVIVNVDKSSEEQLRLPENPEKWPRSIYARLIERLNRYDPAIIAFNIYFGEDRDLAGDAQLAKAIAAGRNVILSNYLKQITFPAADPANEFTYEKVIDPAPALAAAALGAAPFPLPKTAATIKHFWTYKQSAGGIVTFPLLVFECYALKRAYSETLRLLKQIEPGLPTLSEQTSLSETSAHVRRILAAQSPARFRAALAAERLPPDAERLLQAWFSAAQGNDSHYFNHYGPNGTIASVQFQQVMGDRPLNPALFRGKVVIVGYSENLEPEKLQGFYTDFSSRDGGAISTTEIAAAAIANLIDNNQIRPLRPTRQASLIFLWSMLLFGICRVCPSRLSGWLVIAAAAAYAGAACYAFAVYNLWLPICAPLLLQTPIVALAMIYTYLQQNKQDRRKLHKTLSYYLPDQVIADIAGFSEQDGIKHYGALVRGVCMATDAGQYTSLSETLDPKTLGMILNQYYGVMFPEVKNHNGFVSDVVGDSMLALWASPGLSSEMHKINACHAALDIRAAIDVFNREHPYRLPTRFGLHFGEMHLGNVGTTEHFEFRAVGDTVNTAVRIESLNKLLDTQILVSSSVIDGLPDFFARELGAFVLKGKTHAVTLFELIAPVDQVDPYWPPLTEAFCEALALFRGHQWERALGAFESLGRRFPNDGPTRFYAHYLRQNLANPRHAVDDDRPACIYVNDMTPYLP